MIPNCSQQSAVYPRSEASKFSLHLPTLVLRESTILILSFIIHLWQFQLMKCYVWSIALYGAETWTLRATDQKHLESLEMWCWRGIEKISWTDHVRNEEVLLKVKSRGISYMK